jgi:hypothetical protein
VPNLIGLVYELVFVGHGEFASSVNAGGLAGVKGVAVLVIPLERRVGVHNGPEVVDFATDFLAELPARVGRQRKARVWLSSRSVRPPFRGAAWSSTAVGSGRYWRRWVARLGRIAAEDKGVPLGASGSVLSRA